MKSNKDSLAEETVSRREIYKGRSFSFCSDEVRFPDGRIGVRDYVKYPEAVAIVPFIDKDTILLIEQFRYSVGKTLWEIPAGKMEDPKEDKLDAAHRELLEETGYSAGRMEFLFSYYPAVGYSSEIIHIYRASDLIQREQHLDEDEFIRPKAFTITEAFRMIDGDDIKDAKTLLALMVSRYYKK